MNEVVEYFNRFYQIVLKAVVNDSLVHSEWNYFISMFKYQLPEKDRIELYLGILQKEHRGKQVSSQSTSKSISSSQGLGYREQRSGLLDSTQHQLPAIDLKIKQKYSEKWQGQLGSFEKLAGQSLQLRKLSSEQEVGKTSRPPLQSDCKPTKTRKDSYSYALPQSTTPGTNSGLSHLAFPSKENIEADAKQSEADQRHRKLRDISSRIVSMFNSNAGIRC